MAHDPVYATRWGDAQRRPQGIVSRGRSLLRHSALSTLARFSSAGEGPSLRCLYLHYVFDEQRAVFERLLRDLLEIGTFIDTDTCLEMVEGRQPIDRRYFHLSFDDGFRNVVTNASPILRRLGIPALFFVPTAMVGADRETEKRYSLVTTGHAGVIELADWDDLRTAVEDGMEIGSHTRTHARFSEISADPDAVRAEIAGSKQELEERLDRECRYIAWPYGTLGDADVGSLRAVEQAGYSGCFGAFRGEVRPGKTDRFMIPRRHLALQWPLPHLRFFALGGLERVTGRSSLANGGGGL